MRTLIRFIARIDLVLYALCATGIFFAIRQFVVANRSKHLAVYPLEHEAARSRQSRALSTIVSLTAVVAGTYILTNVVEPNLVEPPPPPTPTPVVFLTQEPTPTPYQALFPTITPTVGLPPAEQEVAEAIPPLNADEETVAGCDILGARITSPVAGAAVSGQVSVEGEANILDFAQYKFEISGPATGEAWAVVGTYTLPVISGYLGSWDSTSLLPGSYTLRLVVLNIAGNYPTPCEVPIVIQGPLVSAPTTTPTPTSTPSS